MELILKLEKRLIKLFIVRYQTVFVSLELEIMEFCFEFQIGAFRCFGPLLDSQSRVFRIYFGRTHVDCCGKNLGEQPTVKIVPRPWHWTSAKTWATCAAMNKRDRPG